MQAGVRSQVSTIDRGQAANDAGDRGGTAVEANRARDVSRTGYGATRLSQVGRSPTRQGCCTRRHIQALQPGVDGQVSSIHRGQAANDACDRGGTAIEVHRARDVGRTDDCPIRLSQVHAPAASQVRGSSAHDQFIETGVGSERPAGDAGQCVDDGSSTGDACRTCGENGADTTR